jgi:putative transposase
MKKSQFTESQILAVLKVQLEVEVRRGRAAELKRLKELEAENAKLKRMYADLALENAAIKEVLTRKL